MAPAAEQVGGQQSRMGEFAVALVGEEPLVLRLGAWAQKIHHRVDEAYLDSYLKLLLFAVGDVVGYVKVAGKRDVVEVEWLGNGSFSTQGSPTAERVRHAVKLMLLIGSVFLLT